MPHTSNSPHSHTLHRWELGLVAAASALIAAPYVLPAIGIGDSLLTARVAAICGSSQGGLSQLIEGALGNVPAVGPLLSSTGWSTSLLSGGIGIAGVLLGDYIHKHYDRKGHIQWGLVIKYASLTASALIALPSILSGISMGITFVASVVGGFAAAEVARTVLTSTIGFSGTEMVAPTGLAGLAPHLLTCGRALLPLAATLWEHKKAVDAQPEEPYSVRMLSAPMSFKGKSNTLAFQLIDNKTGRPLSDDEIATTHTQKVHTMVIDNSLSDYHHLHPEYDPARKAFVCQFTPNLQAPYRMWNDFTICNESKPTQIKTDISAVRSYSVPPRIAHTNHLEGAGVSIDIASDKPLRAGEEAILTVTIRNSSSLPVADLEPIMGAYGHLAGFSRDGNFFIHSHPMGLPPQSNAELGTGELRFHLTPPVDDSTKFFLQVKRHGQIMTIPFGQMVAKAHAQGAGTFQTAILPQIASMGKTR